MLKVLFCLSFFTCLFGDWVKTTVGTGMGWASSLVIVPGRNDDTNRIYAAGWNRLYEFTWRNNSWQGLDMGATSGWGVSAGIGRNDGRIRIYATFTVVNPQYGGVYEYTWENGTWQRSVVATFPSGPSSSAGHAVALGPARNDDTIRVYGCDCNNGRTFESTWNGTSWVTNQIFNWAGTDMIIAQGRNDGVYRIYLTKQGTAIREYTWNGQSWEYQELDTLRFYYDVAAGEGRNDSVLRIYAGLGSSPYAVYEFTWNGTSWQKERMKGFPRIPRCVVVGEARNDGIKRVYAGATGILSAMEYTWNGMEWDSSWVDSSQISGRTYGDAWIGDGRNDGTNRLYFGCSDGYLYEFTYSSLGIKEGLIPERKEFIKTAGQFSFPQDEGLKIFTVDGRRVKRINKLPSGVYLLVKKEKEGLRVKRIILR